MTVLRALLLATLAGLLLAPPASAGTLWTICEGKLCTHDERGGGKRVVLGFVDEHPIEDAAVAPDGRRVAATDGRDVYLGTPGGRWRRLPGVGSACCGTGQFHWRRDGRAFLWRHGSLTGQMATCVATRAAELIDCHATHGAGGIDIFGPRGELIWKPRDEGSRLCVRAKQPRRCRRTVLRAPSGYQPYSHAALSPDGRSIVAYLAEFRGRNRLGVFDVATGRLTRRTWRAPGLPVRWSPDSRWIVQVWVRTRPDGTAYAGGVRLRAARGTATRRIAFNGAFVGWTR